MNDLIGHAPVQAFFEKVIDNAALHHAYLFVGREHVGKRAMAEHIAATLLGVSKDALVSHPDVIVLEQEQHRKTGKTKKHIDVEQVRQLKDTVSRHAAMGGYKIAIIDGAEKLNQNASNALLKTLEEPGKQTIIFLLTTDEALLLPTIRSRAHALYFSPVAASDIEAALTTQGAAPAMAQELAQAAYGLPGKALAWLADEEAYQEHKNAVTQFCSLFGQPLYKKMEICEPLFGDKTDHMQTRNALVHTLATWQTVMRDFLPAMSVGAKPCHLPELEKSDILRIFDAIDMAKMHLRKNIHPKILIEHILFAIP